MPRDIREFPVIFPSRWGESDRMTIPSPNRIKLGSDTSLTERQCFPATGLGCLQGPQPQCHRSLFHSRTVSVLLCRLGRLSGWCRCSLFVTRFSNDPLLRCLSGDVSERRVRYRPGVRLLA